MSVLFGREGWLFLEHTGAKNEFHRANLFSPVELVHWQNLVEDRRDWLAKRGIRYVLVIAPSKQAIYPEYLPESLQESVQQSRLKQLTEHLARESDLTFINLTEPLRQAKSDLPLYYKTDTHWNSRGAFVAYQELMKPIKTWFPQVRVSSLLDYDVIDGTRENNWDLAVMAGLPAPHVERHFHFVPRLKTLETARDPLESQVNEVGDEKHQIPKVLVIRDSFMAAMSQFLTPHCREVIYMPPRVGVFPAEEIDQARPQLVIEEIIQRNFELFPPNNPPLVYEGLQSAP
jgi:hypothetical protein